MTRCSTRRSTTTSAGARARPRHRRSRDGRIRKMTGEPPPPPLEPIQPRHPRRTWAAMARRRRPRGRRTRARRVPVVRARRERPSHLIHRRLRRQKVSKHRRISLRERYQPLLGIRQPDHLVHDSPNGITQLLQRARSNVPPVSVIAIDASSSLDRHRPTSRGRLPLELVRAGGHDASRVRSAISGEPPVVVERDAAPRVRRARSMRARGKAVYCFRLARRSRRARWCARKRRVLTADGRKGRRHLDKALRRLPRKRRPRLERVPKCIFYDTRELNLRTKMEC